MKPGPPSTASETTSFWRRKPTLVIGGGLAVAALVASGIGVGSEMADDGDDDGDDRQIATQPVSDDSDDDPAQTPADAGVKGYGAKDAAALTTILSAASEESGGAPTSMEANRNGSWSVDFEAANGDDTTVLVAADGKASVVRTEAADGDDANDSAPAGKLNEQNLSSAITTALAEVKGSIIGVDLDDNPTEAYSVQVLTDGEAETEIDLDADFKVTKTDVDND